MTRSIRISLDLATQDKMSRLSAVLREYRAAANFYARLLWGDTGGLNGETLRRYTNGSLSYNQKTSALNFAIGTIESNRSAAIAIGIRPRCPVFRRALRLTHHICQIEASRGSFDFVIKITSMRPYDQIVIPFKSHSRLNYWMSKPGAKLLDGAVISDKCAWIYVRVPDESLKAEGSIIGLDVGFKKLIVDSDGHFHGQQIKSVCTNVRQKKRSSLGKQRAIRRRNDYVNFVCRRLPWQTTKTFVLEDLTGMKVGKGNRGKRNRKLLAPWSYRQVRTRLERLAPENRVRLEFINPKGTSRTCPSCGLESAKNRVGEMFDCCRCHYTNDADTVGAINTRNKVTTGNCSETMIPTAT